MSRSEIKTSGYYSRHQNNDPYAGMFSRKQLRDLEGETELKVYKQTKKEKLQAERIRRTGISSNMVDSGYDNARAMGRGWGR